MYMLKFAVVIIAAIALLAGMARAEPPGPPRPGMTLVSLDGQEQWLGADMLAGFPGYKLKFRSYKGDTVVTESEVSFIKGNLASMISTRTRGEYDAAGNWERITDINALLFAEIPSARGGLSREEYNQAALKSPAGVQYYLPLLPELTKYSFGNLDIYVHAGRADHFVIEVFSNDFPGFELQDTGNVIPIATRREPIAEKYLGKLEGVTSGKELTVKLPDSAFGPPRNPDGSIWDPSTGPRGGATYPQDEPQT
jgi:hypothetical protein